MSIRIGSGGFPQLPKRKRWYACNVGYMGWNCYKLGEKIEQPKFCPTCRVVDVPAYLPEFLDEYVLQNKFNDRIQVRIPEHSMSPGTYCLGRETLVPPHPESPSGHPTPSLGYKDGNTQPKNQSR